MTTVDFVNSINADDEKIDANYYLVSIYCVETILVC